MMDLIESAQTVDEALSKKDLLKQVSDKLNDPNFKKQPVDPTRTGWTGPKKDDPYYSKNFGHGYPDVGSNRSHNRDVEKSLKKKKGVDEEQLEETEADPVRRIEELFRDK